MEYLYLPVNNYRQKEYKVIDDEKSDKFKVIHRFPNLKWTEIGVFDLLETAILECLLGNDLPLASKALHSARLKRIAEEATGIYYGAFGAITKEDIVSVGYNPESLTNDQMTQLAYELDDDGMSEQYRCSLEALC